MTLTNLRKVDTKILSEILNTSEVLYELGSALIFHMNKTFKQFIEGLTPEEKKNAKLNYQYKDVTNPKRPSDPIKDLKKGRV